MAYDSQSWNRLSAINQLLVEQVEISDALRNYKSANLFNIKNSAGEIIYYAAENSNRLSRYCCGRLRPCDLIIIDEDQTEMIHLYRPLACASCCFPYFLQNMEVSAPPDILVGTIQQEWSILQSLFTVRNPEGYKMLRIRGPPCTVNIFGHITFKIFSADGKVQIGKISKQLYGLTQEKFIDTDYFGVSFPVDLDVRLKAVMIGACFLIVSIILLLPSIA